MNGALFRQTWRAQRLKLAVVSIALGIWGFLMPLIYARFGSQFRAVMESGILPAQVAKFGGGDIFSLPGVIALGSIHPIAIILMSNAGRRRRLSGAAGWRAAGSGWSVSSRKPAAA